MTIFTTAGARSVQLFAAATAMACMIGCGGTPKPASAPQQSLSDLERIERELQDPRSGSQSDPAKPTPPPDADSVAKRAAALKNARERRKEMDVALAAIPTSDAKALSAFAERYRPPQEGEATAADHYLYGRALLIAGLNSESRYRYEQALQRDPTFTLARAALGLWHFRFEEWTEAEKALERAWREDRTDTEVAFYLAYTYDKLNQREKAFILMRDALRSGSDEEASALWLANYYAELKQPAEIVTLLEPIVAKYPANDELKRQLATAYEETGRLADAIAQLEEMLPRLDGGWLVLLHYADLLRRMDRFADAERVFWRVRDEAPAKFFEGESGAGVRAYLDQRIALVAQEKALGRCLLRSREDLIAILQNHQQFDVTKRVEAAQMLFEEQARSDSKQLAEFIDLVSRDPDPAVKIWAPRALQRYASIPRAENFLIYLAKNEQEATEVRATACEALGAGGTELAIDTLLDCLGGEALLFQAANDALTRLTGCIVVVGDGAYLADKPDSRLKKQIEWREKVRRWRERN